MTATSPAPRRATLNITGVIAGDVAIYRCVVNGLCGSVTSLEVDLSLKTETAITLHPQSVAACTGKVIVLNAAATGDGVLTYQWQQNGANIDGATSATYVIDQASSADEGSYHCVITGDCGSVTTNDAVLTIGNSVPADFNGDCDVDGDDYDLFDACASGPGVALSGGCESQDLDLDNDVDQVDFSLFQRCFSGENIPADLNCVL